MSKYFKEEFEEEILISEYIKELKLEARESKKEYGDNEEEKREIREVKWIMEYIGDVKLSRSMIETFSSQFHCCGGRYDVNCEKDTIKAAYEIHKKHPELTSKAIEEIIFIYIKDLFDKYSLVEVLDKLIRVMGKCDETFNVYYEYVDRRGAELQKKYQRKAKMLDKYRKKYGDNYINYLRGFILREHMDVDKIIACMPDAELIKEDEKQLSDISMRTRIFMGCGYPISYSLTRSLAKFGNLDRYPDELAYYVDVFDKKFEATFTKEDFLNAIQKTKKK